MYCKNCGHEITVKERVCPVCHLPPNRLVGQDPVYKTLVYIMFSLIPLLVAGWMLFNTYKAVAPDILKVITSWEYMKPIVISMLISMPAGIIANMGKRGSKSAVCDVLLTIIGFISDIIIIIAIIAGIGCAIRNTDFIVEKFKKIMN